MLTSKALTEMGVAHYLVVEPQEVIAYKRAVETMQLDATVLELDLSYKEKYELCDDFGLTKSTGPGPARNFAWDYSIAELGAAWHWVMDDNISCFRRMTRKERIKIINPVFFRAQEDFVLRYRNVAMAGPNYSMFAFGAAALPPFTLNTRIYSCNLIRNDVPFRWRGRYNEDTILSLDMLKAKWCTIQFNAFLQNKLGTQALKGGNTDEFYHVEGKVRGSSKYADTGTLAKSLMLARVHSDVARMVHKFNRHHHYVDYSRFKKENMLVRDLAANPHEEYALNLRFHNQNHQETSS
jgi:hypothetical protein